MIVNPLIPVPPEQYGGIERIVYMLIQELIKNNHDVTLFAHQDSQPGCKLIAYTEHEHYGLIDQVNINLLTSKIAFQQFDLVHTFGRMSNIALLMFSKTPKIVSYQLPPTTTQVQKAVKMARKNSLYFTACSTHIANQIKDYCHVTAIYNGIDVNDYQFNAEVSPDAPLVFLGRIQQEKGTAIAIEVAKRSGKKLIIAGNIPHEAIHQQYFKDEIEPFIDGEQITYIGPVNNVQKNELLRHAAALLMPVTWHEPFGIVMVEALACGTPVIGFNKGAIPEVVTNGINGFTCDTPEQMVELIIHIKTISRFNCRKIAEEKFNAPVLAQQYEQLYRQATDG